MSKFTSPDVADNVCPDWTHEDFKIASATELEVGG